MHMLKLKQKMKKRTYSNFRRALLFVSITVLLLTAFAYTKSSVLADRFDSQIAELEEENADRRNTIDELEAEASSYQDAIDKLQAKINSLQSSIDANKAKQEDLKRKIAKAQAELEKQKHILGESIRAMYVEGQISTFEMLAASKDLSEFVDKQVYRSSVQSKIKETLDQITALKLKLQNQKTQVEALLKDLQLQQTELAIAQEKQTELLNYNESQQNSYNSQLKSTQKKIDELRRQQAIENARLFGGSGGQLGGGGYPWGYAKCIHTGRVEGWCYNYDWAVGGSVYNWQTGGYGYRNCTDWVAYRVRTAGGYVPSGLGNANTWDNRAPSYGYTVSGTPRKGAAAVSNSGYYGHVMYVESVNSDGSIVVSDYNRAGTGKYDVTPLSAGTASNLRYVYF